MATKPFEFTLQFGAGVGQVDAEKGVLRGVTVAEIGDASGHFAYLDKGGKVIGVGGAGDASAFSSSAKRVQLSMDAKSLQTVVDAGKAQSRFRTREDHDDSIKARAGFSGAFRMDGGKVVCDVNVFDAYPNRGLFLETAKETPELIGLSGDFKFTAEVVGEKAMMRVTRIDAVDIVDQGALTHGGLFKVKTSKVDIPGNPEPENNMPITAAEKTEIVTELTTSLTATFKTMLDEVKAAIKPDPTKELTATFSKLVADEVAKVSATIKTEVEAAAKVQGVEFQKKMSALGMKFTPGAEPTPEELAAAKKLADEAAAAAANAGKGKDFLSMKAARAKEKNISQAEAGRQIAHENPELVQQYRVKLGIIKSVAA